MKQGPLHPSSLALCALALTLLLAACTTGGPRSGSCILAASVRAEAAPTISAFQRVQVLAREARNGTQVHLATDGAPALRIEAAENHLPWIQVEATADGTLRVSVTRCLEGGTPIALYIAAPTLEGVRVEGSSTVHGVTPLQGPEFTLEASGSTTADLSLAVRTLSTNLSGSGDVTLRGSADRFSAEISGSGRLNALALAAHQVAVRISGSGNVQVQAAQALNAAISGSGSVRYAGRPLVNAAVTGSGSVAPME